MPNIRPSKRQRRAAAARAAALSESQSNGNGGGPSTVPQQSLPLDAIPKSSAQDEGTTKAQETMKEEGPEPMVMDRNIEDITQQATESDLDAIEAEKDGPITMLRLSNDIAVLAKHARKLARENSMLRQDVDQATQELKVGGLGIRLLAKHLGLDPEEFMQSLRAEAEEGGC